MKIQSFILALIIFVIFCFDIKAEVIDTNGATYPIAEPDAYEELMNKVKSVNWQAVMNKYKQSLPKVTRVSLNLGKARQDRMFSVDPTYTLPYDIVDENGKVIYPKGFSFNPLDYMNFPYTLVFFNANSVEEITWLQKQDWLKNWNVMLFATQGDVLKAEKMLKKTVYMATLEMVKKFHVSKTPSILSAQNRMLVINEIGVYKNGKQTSK